MNNESTSTGVIIGILIVIVVLVVGFLAYKQGYFSAKDQTPTTNGIEVKVGGNTDNTPSQ